MLSYEDSPRKGSTVGNIQEHSKGYRRQIYSQHHPKWRKTQKKKKSHLNQE